MPNFTITNLINQGTINFHNNNLSIDHLQTVSSSEEIDETFHLNFFNDIKSPNSRRHFAPRVSPRYSFGVIPDRLLKILLKLRMLWKPLSYATSVIDISLSVSMSQAALNR